MKGHMHGVTIVGNRLGKTSTLYFDDKTLLMRKGRIPSTTYTICSKLRHVASSDRPQLLFSSSTTSWASKSQPHSQPSLSRVLCHGSTAWVGVTSAEIVDAMAMQEYRYEIDIRHSSHDHTNYKGLPGRSPCSYPAMVPLRTIHYPPIL
jgi:hypothetical protein